MDIYELSNQYAKDYKQYKKTFAKYNINTSSMAEMQKEIEDGKYKVTVTHSKYHKTSDGNWQSKPYETETKEIDAEFYMNIITAIPLFKDRVTLEYTKYGRIPTRLSCVSWGTGDTKAVREFKFEQIA